MRDIDEKKGGVMIFGEFEKNSSERVRLTRERYKGWDLLDMRIYFADDEGNWKPTKKGLYLHENRA